MSRGLGRNGFTGSALGKTYPTARATKCRSLGQSLADEVDSFHPAARLDAARIAQRILGWRLDPQIVDRGQVTRSCDKVLRAASLSPPAEMALVAGSAGVRAEEGWPPRRDSQESSPREDEARLEFPRLPRPSPANPRIAAGADPATPVDPGFLSDDPADRARVWTMRGTSLDQDRSAPLESDTAGGAVGLDTEAATLDSALAGQTASLSTDECFGALQLRQQRGGDSGEAELRSAAESTPGFRRSLDAFFIPIRSSASSWCAACPGLSESTRSDG